MIILADVHLKDDDDTEETVIQKVFPGIMKAAVEDKDRRLAVLGDLWHVRYHVSVRLQNLVRAWLVGLSNTGVNTILLPGNHDQINEQGESALEVFQDIPRVMVYSSPRHDGWGFWIPYRKNLDDIRAALRRAPISQTLWMHHGVRGALMNNTMADTTGIAPQELEGFPTIMCGHYHKKQTIPIGAASTLHYIGSPYQVDASEAGQSKGYATWDGSEFDWVTTRWGKCYHNLGSIYEGMKLPEILPGDEVRGDVPPGLPLEKVHKFLKESGATVVLTQQQQASEQRLQVKSGATVGDYATQYVAQFAAGLDQAKLLALYQELSNAH